jgi:predicted RNase H-like HicB family nuclease
MTFTAAITHEGDWFVARCLEVEVTSQGETSDDALANLKGIYSGRLSRSTTGVRVSGIL